MYNLIDFNLFNLYSKFYTYENIKYLTKIPSTKKKSSPKMFQSCDKFVSIF